MSSNTLPNEPRVLEPTRQQSLTEQHLLPAVPALMALMQGIRSSLDPLLRAVQPLKWGKPYPMGQCLEISLAVKRRLREFEAAAELSGHAAHYDYYSLVLGYWGTGDTQRALENYDLAVQRDPRLGENKTLHDRTLEWTPLERRAMHETYVLWSKAWRR